MQVPSEAYEYPGNKTKGLQDYEQEMLLDGKPNATKPKNIASTSMALIIAKVKVIQDPRCSCHYFLLDLQQAEPASSLPEGKG